MYRTVLHEGVDEVIIKKSRFIGYVKPVSTEEEALGYIENIKKKHYDATHNCSAYIIGEKMLIQRYTDDGEPSGTAGIPILEVLKKENLTDLVVVVTRYFGGTLLGAGGLIRAYSKGAKIAVNMGEIVLMKDHYRFDITYDYTHQGKILNELNNLNITIEETSYEDKVIMTLVVISEKVKDVMDMLVEVTSANIIIGEQELVLLPIKDGEMDIDE